LWLAGAAHAGEPAPTPRGDPAVIAAATADIEAARTLYAQGKAAEARELLRAVLARDPAPGAGVRQRALAYLGDLLYAEDGASAAEPFFLALLDENPDYVMDPLEHPPEVSRFLESLRPARPPLAVVQPPPPRSRPPWMSLSPGGLYYFTRRETGKGVAVASAQVALLVSNLVLLQQISTIEGVDTRDEAAVRSWQQLELATNLTAGAFYLSLVLPPAVEFSRWDSETTVTVAPGAVQVAGRF
jgi:hypothetical protein